jgi:hypothetical protein
VAAVAAEMVEMAVAVGLAARQAQGSGSPAVMALGSKHQGAGMTGSTEMTGATGRSPEQAPISRTR